MIEKYVVSGALDQTPQQSRPRSRKGLDAEVIRKGIASS
jgi:hypothetical protein